MAQKISRTTSPSPVDPAADAAAELDVLHPERTITLRCGAVTVREYGHVEWLRALPAAAPLVAAIAGMLESGTEPSYEDALLAVATHIDGLRPLIAQAADIDLNAFDSLPPDEGELLLMTWWGVNGRFFTARALNRVAVARAERAARVRAVPSAGASSTPPSSPTDTAAPISPATPSAS